MSHPIPFSERLRAASETVHADLLAARESGGHWVGELAGSPLSTATAIVALVLAEQHGRLETHGRRADVLFDSNHVFQGNLSELIVGSLNWLADQQNYDGGWGDTDKSKSNIATTMIVVAAFHLTGVPARNTNLLEQAEQYIKTQGGVAMVRKRYGKDKTFAAPILACCALAGMISWREVPALPFELACIPASWYRLARMPVVSYAIPALVAIGQARHFHAPTFNPITRLARRWAKDRSLEIVERMQPTSGGFLEATPLTSFVVMCLASIGLAEHPIVRRGVEFLLSEVRPDGSWPIDANLAMWNTTQAVCALMPEQTCSEREELTSQSLGERDASASWWGENEDCCSDTSGLTPTARQGGTATACQGDRDIECLDWILDCQHTETHPFTGSEPGGWSWTDLPGGVPDVDDTSGALLALSRWRRHAPNVRRERIEMASRTGIRWLLDMQNRDGGWPTFCRGWGKLPFDRSATDLTAHAIRAIHAWQDLWQTSDNSPRLDAQLNTATERGIKFLDQRQHPVGSWTPLWFGNQHNANDENPVYGTARVLKMLAELGRQKHAMSQQAAEWLASVQHASGGWGAVTSPPEASGGQGIATRRPGIRDAEIPPESHSLGISPPCSVEETALAVSSLLPFVENDEKILDSFNTGVEWLVEAVEAGWYHESSPIGFYFANLWYYEALYPLIFVADALGAAVRSVLPVENVRNNEQSWPTQTALH